MKTVKAALESEGLDPAFMHDFQYKRVVFTQSGNVDDYEVGESFDIEDGSNEEDEDVSEFVKVRDDTLTFFGSVATHAFADLLLVVFSCTVLQDALGRCSHESRQAPHAD